MGTRKAAQARHDKELKLDNPVIEKQKDNTDKYIQNFTNRRTTFIKDEKTGRLKRSGTEDLQEIINSAVENTLDELYEKFTKGESIKDSFKYIDEIHKDKSMLFDDTGEKDKLARLSTIIAVADKYRDENHLPISMSHKEIFERMEQDAATIKENIKKKLENSKKINKQKQEAKAIKEQENEKKVIKKDEQKGV